MCSRSNCCATDFAEIRQNELSHTESIVRILRNNSHTHIKTLSLNYIWLSANERSSISPQHNKQCCNQWRRGHLSGVEFLLCALRQAQRCNSSQKFLYSTIFQSNNKASTANHWNGQRGKKRREEERERERWQKKTKEKTYWSAGN